MAPKGEGDRMGEKREKKEYSTGLWDAQGAFGTAPRTVIKPLERKRRSQWATS